MLDGHQNTEEWVTIQTNGDCLCGKCLCPPSVHVVSDEAKRRKQRPITTGVLDYFPDAITEVAYCSYVGNSQHHPDEPLHWDKSKSTDEADSLVRHLLARGTTDTDGVRHSAKVVWRALALLQRELDSEKEDEH